MVAITPDGVVQVVLGSDDTGSLVRVDNALVGDIVLVRCQAPVLDLDMLPGLLRARVATSRDGLAVKVSGVLSTGPVNDGGHDVEMRSDKVDGLALGNVGSANHHRHIHIFLVGAALAGGQAVLADVEAVVTGVDDVGVLQHVVLLQLLDRALDQIIDRLQGLETTTVHDIVLLDFRLVELLGLTHPAGTAWL